MYHAYDKEANFNVTLNYKILFGVSIYEPLIKLTHVLILNSLQ